LKVSDRGQGEGGKRCRHPVRGHGSTSAVAMARIPSLAAHPCGGCCNAPRERADFTETAGICVSRSPATPNCKMQGLQMVTL
jgi:hypothetical protein